jgi:hypothetical protein
MFVMGRRGVAVSILACQAKGRGFKSRRLRTERFRERELMTKGQLIRSVDPLSFSACVALPMVR